ELMPGSGGEVGSSGEVELGSSVSGVGLFLALIPFVLAVSLLAKSPSSEAETPKPEDGPRTEVTTTETPRPSETGTPEPGKPGKGISKESPVPETHPSGTISNSAGTVTAAPSSSQPDQHDAAVVDNEGRTLAVTGANVLWTLVIGLMLSALGVFLVTIRRRRN
ncbi:LPXTG cell wall anchor domain-containing protein, partial [Corynebacterium sp. CCM 9203]|uniref:LPXTG cell wall anchor domain-containing protein n=1 Tax=Corynebacterium sp. CCM 9203 TaxID=3057615 RepID=UPI0035246EFE